MKLRPQFSLRVLMILPVFVGLFFACGSLTRTYGTDQVKVWLEQKGNGGRPMYEAPLLFSKAKLAMKSPTQTITTECYFVWLFGPVFEVPFERTYIDSIGPGVTVNDIAKRRLLKE
ncbi:hypothetical protein FYK55_26195 [Roseiconus nitratireducens]|uniref:Lipoprotein n=1 Tax=Roseiconus nitratireducens TaxID=2605748 RepID=A0A5M6CX10_9BACT|nr:hypothetical protein [Roseiconus nitratireducens]KAA5538930.1 hypothetical protein FYK55_26195 [Roseiconus nitratireducens]